MSGFYDSVFSYVKDHTSLYDFVSSTGLATKITEVSPGVYRCNNIISGGDNPTAMLINDNDGFFKVFSHGGESGDIISLYQLLHPGITPKDSALHVAQETGVEVPESLKSKKGTSTTKLLEVLDEVAEKTHRYLLQSNSSEAKSARDYLTDRGMDDDLISQWKLGLMPADFTKTKKFLEDVADSKTLEKAGLYSTHGAPLMWGRLTMPIFNSRGDVVSFSARRLDHVPCGHESAKYVNTATTTVYNKSTTLYGMHLFNPDTHTVVICEGNFDTIALNASLQEGTVAVATCGTSLTQGHIKFLLSQKNPPSIVVMFDSDDAGRDAEAKSVWIKNHTQHVFAATPPGGKDPWDGYIAGEDMNRVVENAEDILISATNYQSDNLSRNKFLSWVKKTAQSLTFFDDRKTLVLHASKAIGMSEKALSREIESPQRKPVSRKDTGKFSTPVLRLIPGMMSIEKDKRPIVFFSFFTPKMRETINSVLRLTDKDSEIIDQVLGISDYRDEEVLKKAFEYYPSPDSEEISQQNAAAYICSAVMRELSLRPPKKSERYLLPAIIAISRCSSKAQGVQQLSFSCEALSLVH